MMASLAYNVTVCAVVNVHHAGDALAVGGTVSIVKLAVELNELVLPK
jgi:hypothetical protein